MKYDHRYTPQLAVSDGDEVYLKVTMKHHIQEHLERGPGKVINARTADRHVEKASGLECADVWWFDAGWSETVPLICLTEKKPENSLRFKLGGSEDAEIDWSKYTVASFE